MSASTRRAFDDLAARLREVVREEMGNHGTSFHRFTVRQATPTLVIEQMQGDLVLEDGDPDLVIGDGLRQVIAQYGLAVGAQVWVIKQGDQYHAVDCASAANVVAMTVA